MQISPFQGTISKMLGVNTPQPESSASFSLYNQNTWHGDQFQLPQAIQTTAPPVAFNPVPNYAPSQPAIGQISPAQGQLISPQQLFQPSTLTSSPRPQARPQNLSQYTQVGQLAPLPLDRVPIPRPRPQNLSIPQALSVGDPHQIIDTGLKDIQGRKIKLTREAAQGLNQIIAIAKARGIDVRVHSSHRTIEHQEDLWEAALEKYGSASKARKWVAPPGKSRHNYGKAIDMHMYRGKNKISQKEFDEIIAKAGMYRPMSWEGWHVEPLSTKKERSG